MVPAAAEPAAAEPAAPEPGASEPDAAGLDDAGALELPAAPEDWADAVSVSPNTGCDAVIASAIAIAISFFLNIG
jgi:hypothetical protein